MTNFYGILLVGSKKNHDQAVLSQMLLALKSYDPQPD